MRHPKVSVIVPTYNRAHFLGEAIQSILDQTFYNFEIIIVDDGSTDGTDEFVSTINDSCIRYMFQENRGISAARNAALRLARGEFVAFLDSDDVWLPVMLEVEVSILQAKFEIGLVYARSQDLDKIGESHSFSSSPWAGAAHPQIHEHGSGGLM